MERLSDRIAKRGLIGMKNFRQSLMVLVQKLLHPVTDIPNAFRRAFLRVSIAYMKSFLKDHEADVKLFSEERKKRTGRKGRQDFQNVNTMEIDSRLVKAMDDYKKEKQAIVLKEEKLRNLTK